ncbi:S41 family peptidase [Pyxidicoccus trucidator]|uniref:S41 family peptidase n=1 Tax=Pyxidicoccus trucidator TaxID=2709662 RepID=UPI0023DE012D|nr:S41 family peptidase [Pyxidicoccus trucidator]
MSPNPQTRFHGRGRRAPTLSWLLLAACILQTACSDEKPPGPPPVEVPAPQAIDWCPYVAAGPPGTAPGALAMSSAHALVRFFSPGSHYVALDAALVRALEGPTVDWDAAARVYAEALESVCALETVAEAPLPAVSVEDLGGIAVIHPGTGDVTLPAGARAVAIDLRVLPAAPGLEEALGRAISAASTGAVARVNYRVRVHKGLMDEVREESAYSNTTTSQSSPPYTASGAAELPVALLTSPTLAPAAARFAVDLRAAGRAWLFGEPVATAVAESRWVPIGARGLAIRVLQLEDSAGPLPDLLPADRALQGALADSLRELPTLGAPTSLDRSVPAARAKMERRRPQEESRPTVGESPGIARASLVIAHGAMRRFFPYFPVVGDGIDARLEETLAAVDAAPVSRERLIQHMRRFGAVLQDGHNFVFAANPPTIGYLPALFTEVQGEAVVRRSMEPGMRPGDTLVRIGPRSAADWYAEELARTSAATPGYRFDLATRRLREMTGPLALGLRALDGSERTVEVQPQPSSSLTGLGSLGPERPAGWLDDLGAPSLYYLNLDTAVLDRMEDFRQSMTEATKARGLVVDMRGYPGGINHYLVAAHLIQQPFVSPLFRYTRWTGPDQRSTEDENLNFEPVTASAFTGPIVLLVGPHSVSAAENFAIMLVATKRVRVVGQRSAGTNGNITTLLLPGFIQFLFTGMEVLHPDGSTFHGVGIVPDVEAAPTAEDIATGRDPELLKAIELLLQ